MKDLMNYSTYSFQLFAIPSCFFLLCKTSHSAKQFFLNCFSYADPIDPVRIKLIFKWQDLDEDSF